MPQPVAIRLEVLYSDNHLVELRIQVANGRFQGQADMYVALDWATQLTGRLRGFPDSVGASREIELGNWKPDCGGGGLRLAIRTTDRAGHLAVDLQLRACPHSQGSEESVQFRAAVDPADIDEFVAELDAMRVKVGDCAVLMGKDRC
ncbi:MAG: hypothetical protein ISR76_05215 [Planctomycetes bacterium]|nr:hypothetical protein [Planctomycetota bacterium]MBL7008377.1 hypothetical protein [Planctomycetota bacterium]